jgi:hypothetical protein
LQRYLQLDGVGVCPHDDSGALLLPQAAAGAAARSRANVWNIDLASSFIVGDRWRDIEAGHRAGCRAIFVDYGYAEQRPDGPVRQRPLAARSRAMDSAQHSPGFHGIAICLTRHRFVPRQDFRRRRRPRFHSRPRRNPWIKGFTTNPTLMRKAGITDYEAFGRSLIARHPDRPFSFEVLSDDFDEMEQQALQIASPGATTFT